MMMATIPKTPPRSWEFDDLLALGKRGGVTYLKSIPVIILEEWIQQGRGAKVYVRTKSLERRLVESELHPPFKSKGTSNILAALSSIQIDRNLTNPSLMETKLRGGYWVNIKDYKDLLEEFRQYYCKQFSEDYRKLYAKGEPQWQTSIIQDTKTSLIVKPELGKQEEIKALFMPIENALRDRENEIKILREQNKNLQSELGSLRSALQEKRDNPRYIIFDDELRNDCEKHLETQETYIDAIRRAGVVLEERLKSRLGDEGKYGVDLVDDALKKVTGKLIISDHSAEQEGVHMLFRGAVQFVRNPPAHKKMQYTEHEAWQTISLIDYLLLLLRQAKLR